MHRMTLHLIILFLLNVPAIGAQPEQKGYNSLFIGHSFFVPVAKVFENLPNLCGVKNHKQQHVFSAGITGSPGRLWTGDKRPQIEQILATGEIDLLGMTYYSPENSAIEHYQSWIDVALKHNPKTTFFVGLPWAKHGESRELAEYKANIEQGNNALYHIVQKLRTTYPKNKFIYVAYGRSSAVLKGLFEAKKLPEVTGLVDPDGNGVYTDKMGHAGPLLKKLAAVAWVKAIYPDVDLSKLRPHLSTQMDLIQLAEEIVTFKDKK